MWIKLFQLSLIVQKHPSKHQCVKFIQDAGGARTFEGRSRWFQMFQGEWVKVGGKVGRRQYSWIFLV